MRSPLLATLMVLAALVLSPSEVAAQVQVVRRAEQLTAWADALLRAGKNTDESADAIRALRRTASVLEKEGEAPSDAFVEFVQREWNTMPRPLLESPEMFRALARRAERGGSVVGILRRYPTKAAAENLARIVGSGGAYSNRLLEYLAVAPEDVFERYMRGLVRGSLAGDDLLKCIESIPDIHVQGEAFEQIARRMAETGELRKRLGLRSVAIQEGQYNSLHGIDGIGVAEDGRPVFFEFSAYPYKKLSREDGVHQLSPQWCFDRFQKLKARDPEHWSALRARLVADGVEPRYLDEATIESIRSCPRKFIALHPEALTDSNRLSAELGMNDLISLTR